MGATTHVDLGDRGVVEGTVDARYKPVLDAFVANFAGGDEVGAGVCVYRHGEPVVDLVGGWARPSSAVPYGPDTLQLVFSTTKGGAAICAHQLVEQGALDLDAPVAAYWPEFAAGGKAEIPVRYLLTHQAGLPTIDGQLPIEDVLAWGPIVDALATQAPLWAPGTAHGYHALTYGWLVGELVRRVSGRRIGEYFADHVAAPLGLDFWIGLPPEAEARVAPLRLGELPAADPDDKAAAAMLAAILAPDALLLRALSLNGAFDVIGGGDNPFNAPAVHAAEMPAANGITNARSLARMYAATVGDVDGVRLLQPDTVATAVALQVDGPDKVLITPTRFGLGFMLDSEFAPLLGPSSFGHTGAGGSVGFADPDTGVGFGYVMNQMRLGLAADPRSLRLMEALRTCID